MKYTKVLLNESVRALGKVGDVVEVSPGYARNHLLPQGIAVEPTKQNLKRVEERRKEIERVERERRAAQEALIAKLNGVELTLVRRANEQGHLFGSVGASDISRALHEQGFAVEAEDINLPGKLDHIDKYVVEVAFADDLTTDIKVYVAPDADSKASIELYAKEQSARNQAAQNAEA